MTDYMRFLRKHVGHHPVLQCGASVIIQNEKGEILLQRRSDNDCWGYAGGSVELGETVEETAMRELFEETGLVADEIHLFSVFSGEDVHYVYPNGDEVYNVDIVFICTKYHGELKPDGSEVKDLSFFPIENLPNNISPPVMLPIKKYIETRTK